MVNYEIAPHVLRPYLPAGTELDVWHGNTLISVVGFLFLDTRVSGVAVPFHRDFEEVNLRFYVHRRADDGWRRGVVFIKEIVPRVAIAAIARLIYNENYIALPMRHAVDLPEHAGPGSVAYHWRYRGRWNGLRARTVGPAQPLTSGSQAEFITEHYWGYAAQRDAGCVEYQVEHPRWRVWSAVDAVLDCDVGTLYGESFVDALSATPTSAFVADGSPIAVRQGKKI